jgi:hypothetical protein
LSVPIGGNETETKEIYFPALLIAAQIAQLFLLVRWNEMRRRIREAHTRKHSVNRFVQVVQRRSFW